MKTALPLALATLLLTAALPACTSNSDSVEAAEKANAARNEALPTESAEKKADFDASFLVRAASHSLMAQDLCSLVAKRATTPAVREYAQRMMVEHSRATQEISALAQRRKVVLPTMMGEEAQEVFRNVEEKQGVALDRTFVREIRQDHEAEIREYAAAIERAADPDIRTLATRLQPYLQEHLALVTELEQQLRRQ